MASEPLLIEFSEPIPATLRLPGVAGSVEGRVIAAEIQPNGEPWIQVRIPMWQRWTSQVKVGEPSLRGIGPYWTEVWAPGTAVDIDVEREPEVEEQVRRARARA